MISSGDFRQILPIVKGGTRANQVNASLKASKLWSSTETLKLRKNTRVYRLGDQSAESFSNLLLDIGNGNIEIDPTDGMIDVPDGCGTIVNTEDMLIESVYPEFSQNYTNMEWLFERGILAPRNDLVGNINTKLLNKFLVKHQFSTQ